MLIIPLPATQRQSQNQPQKTQLPLTRNIPNGLEGQVRTSFLRHLSKMDPLDCLPKVFCEVSADPKIASEIFGYGNFIVLLLLISFSRCHVTSDM